MKRLLLALCALAAASAGADTLPKGFKFVEYIESSGTNVTGEFYAYYGTRTDFTAFIPPPGTVIFVR